MEREDGFWCFMAAQVALVNSVGREVKRGVHQGLDVGDGQERGAKAFIRVVSVENDNENHLSSCSGERRCGG